MEMMRKVDQYYLALILDGKLEIQEQKIYAFQIVRVFRCGQAYLHHLALKRLRGRNAIQ
jgi:hypothetical protein